MRSYIFPVKLASFIHALDKAASLPQVPEIPLQTPVDDCERYVLCSSELHDVVSRNIEDARAQCSRKRLAIPRGRDLATLVEHTKLEIYSEDYVLIYSCPIVHLRDEMSLAVEVELMSHLLRSTHLSITMM